MKQTTATWLTKDKDTQSAEVPKIHDTHLEYCRIHLRNVVLDALNVPLQPRRPHKRSTTI